MSDTNWESYGHEVIWVGFEKDMGNTIPKKNAIKTVKPIAKNPEETPHTIIDFDRLMEIVVYG